MGMLGIAEKVSDLKIGDRIRINLRAESFYVCGVSDRFVLAHRGNEYTIISKEPTDYLYNGIQAGAIICGADWWVLGWHEGYDFFDPAWVERYLQSLESGETEISSRRREEIVWLEVKRKN